MVKLRWVGGGVGERMSNQRGGGCKHIGLLFLSDISPRGADQRNSSPEMRNGAVGTSRCRTQVWVGGWGGDSVHSLASILPSALICFPPQPVQVWTKWLLSSETDWYKLPRNCRRGERWWWWGAWWITWEETVNARDA